MSDDSYAGSPAYVSRPVRRADPSENPRRTTWVILIALLLGSLFIGFTALLLLIF